MNKDGAVLHSAALSVSEVEKLNHVASGCAESAGERLFGNAGVRELLGDKSSVAEIVQSILGKQATPVRAVLFDKSPKANWALGWHQDRTIVVRERADIPGYGPWSTKNSMQHVEPPFSLFESMVTVRVHLDEVDADNAPLLIALGSHQGGRIPVGEISKVVSDCKVHTCLADMGDVWVYQTPILHASELSKSKKRRRVLQADFCNASLPEGLEWLGI